MARSLARVIVATDDERIASAVRAAGGEAEMTASTHPSGTDRIAEVAAKIEAEIYLNVQGDLPFIAPPISTRWRRRCAPTRRWRWRRWRRRLSTAGMEQS